MARIVKSEREWHSLRLRSDFNNGELIVMGHGKNIYLWVSKDREGESITTYSGRIALRKLAKHILKCVEGRSQALRSGVRQAMIPAPHIRAVREMAEKFGKIAANAGWNGHIRNSYRHCANELSTLADSWEREAQSPQVEEGT